MWEEPCVSGTNGSGTVFFSGCSLGCIFCQNHKISKKAVGAKTSISKLAHIFISLQKQNVHNINLVTGSHYLPWIKSAVLLAKKNGLKLPIVWNTSGYETPRAACEINTFCDVWLIDLKIKNPELCKNYLNAKNYFSYASSAVTQLCNTFSPPVFNNNGTIKKGVIIRLLPLPSHSNDCVDILNWLNNNTDKTKYLLSIMRQYTPPALLGLEKPLNRTLFTYEYTKVCDAAIALGFKDGYFQKSQSIGEKYVPDFDAFC
jgi:putative pyruvate formate lyase activating enzyme